ncbi:MAG: DNA-processing protein DprA [Candidatus Kapaibacterium sp.]
MSTSSLSRSWDPLDLLQLRAMPRMTSRLFIEALESASGFDAYLEGPVFHQTFRRHQEVLFERTDRNRLRDEALKQLERCQRARVSLVSILDERYPDLLRRIPYPPNLLFVRGTLRHHESLSLSIVGTRQCTQYGHAVTERFARDCSEAGLIITSGLAAGIDSIAHKVTVDRGGVTYAVIACGIDVIAPSYAAHLARSISEGQGAVISEYPCGVRALPPYFPQRNRIISGISKALLVVESGRRGGSLITARFAMDQARDVYAIPGMITAERSMGTNLLIAESAAAAALTPQQILLDYGLRTEATETAVEFGSSAEERVFAAVSHEPVHIDALAERFDLPAADVLVILLTLEFKGYVRQLPGRMFVREMLPR